MANARHWFTSLIAGSLLLSGQAFAHAHLSNATPAEGAKVTAPKAISITFSEGLELAFSGVSLSTAAGKAVPLGEITLTKHGKTLTAPLDKALKAGQYAVKWHVLSTDGHKTSGQYLFTVAP